MSWLYLPEQVVDYSEANCSDGEQSATSKTIPTASRSSNNESEMECLTTHPSGTRLEHSTGIPGLDVWISSLAASPASHGALPENMPESWMNAISGRTPFALFEKSNPNGAYWKMSQASYFDHTFAEYSQTWPKAGIVSAGIAYQLRSLVRRTYANGSGLWPTPVANDDNKTPEAHLAMKNRMKGGPRKTITSLQVMVKAVEKEMFPTPTSTNTKSIHLRTNGRPPRSYLPTPKASDGMGGPAYKKPPHRDGGFMLKEIIHGGQLNPNWVEWLMGWPIGWTALEPLEMDRFQQWLELHGD